MRTTITRSLVESKIHACKVEFENGQPKATPLEPIIVYGNVSNEQAKREITKKFGKDANVVLAKIESEEKHFEISVADFIKHAKVVEKNDEQTEEN